jgi:hypothetical protein
MFLRLCAWGTGAALAIAAAIAAGRTELGAKRAHAMLEAIFSNPVSPENQAAQRLTAWSNEVGAEVRRQADMIRALVADREGMARKLTVMDGRIGDLAGTLASTTTRLEGEAKAAQQAAASAVAALVARAGQGKEDSPDPMVPSVSVPGAPGVSAGMAASARGLGNASRTPAGSLLAGQIRPAATSAAASAPIPPPVASVPPDAALAYTGAIPMPAAPEGTASAARPMAAVDPTASVPLPRANAVRAPAVAPKSPLSAPFPANPLMTTGIFDTPIEPGEIATAFGIDLGPAGTIEAARTRWNGLRASVSPLFDNLKPLITVKDGGRSGQELHLIAGPLTSMASSARLCAVLAGSSSCQPTVFEGQRLSVR